MNILIEPIRKEEITEVLAIERRSFSNPWIRSQFEECIDTEGKQIYAAKADGEIVGYIVFEHILDEGYISDLVVKEGYREQGIGSKLVAFILQRSNGTGIKWVELEVREKNEKAIRFYSNLGFKEIRRRLGYYINPAENALVMRLDLTKKKDLIK